MFQGFTDETFEFFMAIRFNNNTEFFHGNHDWYVRAVRTPCLELAGALSEAMDAVDGAIELRPNRVVSRINRDLRFSRDKSPYRDYIWLRFRRPPNGTQATVGFYFDISAEGASYGMGFYEENKSHMNGLRRRFETEPEAFLERLDPLRGDFKIHLNAYKRMKLPESLHPDLREWYPIRSFWLVHEITDWGLLKSPALVDYIADGVARLAPLYHYFYGVPPEIDEDETREPGIE